jgi:hypothetical protein
MITEVFGRSLPRLASMAGSWAFLHKVDRTVIEIMQANGLLPPPAPPKPQTLWRRMSAVIGF